MKFSYRWKNARNERQSGELDAPSRDAAFEILRSRGIRAISVEPADGGKAARRNRTLGVATLALACLVAGAAAAWFRSTAGGGRDTGNGKDDAALRDERYVALAQEAEAIRRGHRAALDKLRLDWARNYAMIEHMGDVRPVVTELERGQAAVKYARLRVADMFKGVLEMFPEDSAKGRAAAQRLYGELMDELDLDEYNLSCAEMAVSLLADNRGRWHEVKGQVVWSDDALRREFDRYATESDAATARWRRDFTAATPIEQDTEK